MTTQKTFTLDNLTLTQTIFEDSKNRTKTIEVTRFNGEYYELIDTNSDDARRVFMAFLNNENGY